MDFATVIFVPKGRMGRGPYWLGAAVLLVASVLHFLPVFSFLFDPFLLYCWICVLSKRLRDFGLSGWLSLTPLAVFFATIAFAIMASSPGDGGAAQGSSGYSGYMVAIVFLTWLAVIIGVGIPKGAPGPNRYGPPAAKGPAPQPS